jgi:hypothetical protein
MVIKLLFQADKQRPGDETNAEVFPLRHMQAGR